MKKISNTVLFSAMLAVVFAFTSCTTWFGHGSTKIEGDWMEYRADDPTDTYLLSHLRFRSDGTGKFWLTDGAVTRDGFAFTWEQEDGDIIVHTPDGDSYYSFNNGLITEESAFGDVVYRKI